MSRCSGSAGPRLLRGLGVSASAPMELGWHRILDPNSSASRRVENRGCSVPGSHRPVSSIKTSQADLQTPQRAFPSPWEGVMISHTHVRALQPLPCSRGGEHWSGMETGTPWDPRGRKPPGYPKHKPVVPRGKERSGVLRTFELEKGQRAQLWGQGQGLPHHCHLGYGEGLPPCYWGSWETPRHGRPLSLLPLPVAARS